MEKLIFALVLTISFISSALSQTKTFLDQPYLEVNGYSDTLIIPNQIFIKIVISERDSKDKVSLEEQENKMIQSLKALQINTDTDLTISDMLSNYKAYLLKSKDIVKTKEYILKVSDATTASKVFIQLEELGISNTSINRVDHTNLESFKNVCRTKAIENAKRKAISLTKPLMQSVGNAIYITDNEANLDNQVQGRLAGVVVRGYGAYSKDKYEAPKVEFEKIKVTASVGVKFILK